MFGRWLGLSLYKKFNVVLILIAMLFSVGCSLFTYAYLDGSRYLIIFIYSLAIFTIGVFSLREKLGYEKKK